MASNFFGPVSGEPQGPYLFTTIELIEVDEAENVLDTSEVSAAVSEAGHAATEAPQSKRPCHVRASKITSASADESFKNSAEVKGSKSVDEGPSASADESFKNSAEVKGSKSVDEVPHVSIDLTVDDEDVRIGKGLPKTMQDFSYREVGAWLEKMKLVC